MKLSASEEDRFSRHTKIEGWDQARLKQLGIVVLGAGALGNEVLKNLAMLGVGRLLIVDMDRVENSNLTRSALFRESDAGRLKAEVAAERVLEIWPEAEVETVVDDLHLAVGPGRLARYDLALSCLDSLDARLGVDRLCRRAGIPWWNGGLGVSSAEVQRFDPHDGPCFACVLPRRALERELQRWSCQSGRPTGLEVATMPTTAVSASVGGALLVQEALAATFPDWNSAALPAGGRLLWEAVPPRVTRFEVPRDPSCFAHDDAPGAVDHAVPFTPAASAQEILQWLGHGGESWEVHLPVDLVVQQHCGCGKPADTLIALRKATGRCPRCGEEPTDLQTRNAIAAGDPLAIRPLADCSIPEGGELVLSLGGKLATIRLTGDPAPPAPEISTPRSASIELKP